MFVFNTPPGRDVCVRSRFFDKHIVLMGSWPRPFAFRTELSGAVEGGACNRAGVNCG
jgi:hypothetical protein